LTSKYGFDINFADVQYAQKNAKQSSELPTSNRFVMAAILAVRDRRLDGRQREQKGNRFDGSG
jgi:hypothetical protein